MWNVINPQIVLLPEMLRSRSTLKSCSSSARHKSKNLTFKIEAAVVAKYGLSEIYQIVFDSNKSISIHLRNKCFGLEVQKYTKNKMKKIQKIKVTFFYVNNKAADHQIQLQV